MKLHFLKLLH